LKLLLTHQLFVLGELLVVPGDLELLLDDGLELPESGVRGDLDALQAVPIYWGDREREE
jgi:hypothetical protein